MTQFLSRLLGRLPIGWLQLKHNRGRLLAAIAGIAFANLLVFVQLGIQGAMTTTGSKPYSLFNMDVLLLPSDARNFSDGGKIPRQRMFEALSVAGVEAATPVYIGMAEWRLPDETTASMEVYGIDPSYKGFLGPEMAGKSDRLILEDAVVVDTRTRGLTDTAQGPELIGEKFEFSGRELTVVDIVTIGGGFMADGVMLVSDQTFLRLFPSHSSGSPNRIFIQTASGADDQSVVERIEKRLDTSSVRVLTLTDAISADLAYQTTERPTGIIFGFGVLMGVLVGVVIVYQVLSTDVANHMKEYATFKAIGYGQAFFLGIIVEQAVILAVTGFVPGILAAIGLYQILTNATGLPVVMDFERAFAVFGGTLIACIISGLLAMRKLATADPADLF